MLHVSRVVSALKTLTVRVVDVAVSAAKNLAVTMSFVTVMRLMRIVAGAASRVSTGYSVMRTMTVSAVTASADAVRLRLAWMHA